MRRSLHPAAALALMMAAAGCATPRAAAPAGAAAPPPRFPFPLPDDEALRRRPPLVLPGTVLVHQVAVKVGPVEQVLIGRMRFDGPASFHLEAQTPFGVTLFTLGCDGSRCRATAAPALRRRLPLLALATQIRRIYLAGCRRRASIRTTRDRYVVACVLPDRTQLVDILDGRTLALRRRAAAGLGRVALTITYRDYAWYPPLYHPRRITVRGGDAEVEILLQSAETGRPDAPRPAEANAGSP